MTPADSPSPAASTRFEASFTNDGTKTTAAPSAVAAPAPQTRAKATATFGLSTVMVYYCKNERALCCFAGLVRSTSSFYIIL